MIIGSRTFHLSGYPVKPKYGSLVSWLVFVLFFFVLVVPNSFRSITVPLFLLLGILLIFCMQSFNKYLIWVWLLGSFVTFLYLLIGVSSSGLNAINQVVFVYVVSPFIWILILSFVFANYNIQSILRIVFYFSFIGALSVPFFVAYFLLYGADGLTWLIAVPNVQLESGYAGVTMHVLGPLAFIIAGYFAAPKIIHNPLLRYGIAFVFIVAVVLSGRTALFLSLFIGVFSFFLFRHRINLHSVFYFTITSFIISLCIYWLSTAFNFDLFVLFDAHFHKILEGGGQARILQADALTHGIYSNLLLGSGHGVGVDIIRNDDFPWRYELLYLATLYRVGLVGLIVYSLPIFFIIKGYLSASRSESQSWLGLCDKFIFVGFITGIVISATNPYLESFEFQWMFFGPLVYFINRNPPPPNPAQMPDDKIPFIPKIIWGRQ